MEEQDTQEPDTQEPDAQEPDGNVYIVPTSHVSEESSETVKQVVKDVQPDTVAVELDEPRLQKLIQQPAERDISIKQLFTNTDVSRRGRLVLYVFGLMQSRVGSILDVDILGQDMLAGYEASKSHDTELALVDRNIKETFNRLSDEISVTELTKTLSYFVFSYLFLLLPWRENKSDSLETDNIDIETVLTTMEDTLPTFKEVLIDERNKHMASGIMALAEQRDSIVLVIGAAHEPGIRKMLEDSENTTVKPVSQPSL